jgi:hypothetical protein
LTIDFLAAHLKNDVPRELTETEYEEIKKFGGK